MRPTFQNPTEFINTFWQYYKLLESDVLSLEKYVTFETNNFKTYSNEFIKFYQTIGGEIDVVAKVLCKLLDDGSSAEKIFEYRREIVNKLPLFASTQVHTKTNEIIGFAPWKPWDSNGKLIWWEIYNKVKHERLTTCTEIEEYRDKKYYQAANLENILNALAALYILEFYCILILCKNVGNYQSLIFCLKDSMFDIRDWSKYCYGFMGQVFIDDKKIRCIIDNYIK